jgi:dephospho-CoA kinase
VKPAPTDVLILIGRPGSGKSTAAALLAARADAVERALAGGVLAL